MPFANADDAEVEGWVNGGKPIVGHYNLLAILQQRTFCIVVDKAFEYASKKFCEESLPPPFHYPYGTDQDWDVDKFKDLIKANKGHQFVASYW